MEFWVIYPSYSRLISRSKSGHDADRNASHMDFNFPEKKGTGALGLRKNGWRYDLPSGDVKIAIENDNFSWENPLLMV